MNQHGQDSASDALGKYIAGYRDLFRGQNRSLAWIIGIHAVFAT